MKNSWLEIVFSFYSDRTLSLSRRRCRSFCSVRRQPHACVEKIYRHARAAAQPSLRWAKVQRRIQCSIRLLESKPVGSLGGDPQPYRAACVDFFVSVTVPLVRLEVEVPCSVSFFQSYFFLRVVFIFSRYLTDRQRAYVVPMKLKFLRVSPALGLCVFTIESGERSQGRTSLATESGLGESGKTFHIEEKKPAALLGRARSKA